MSLANEIRKSATLTNTENGAVAYNTTDSYMLDFFAEIGSYRLKTDDEIISAFEKAYNENKKLAMKCLFYARDIPGRERLGYKSMGLGERRVFRVIMNWLAINHTDVADSKIDLIPEFGRWDDLYCFVDTPLERKAFSLIARQIKADLSAYYRGGNVSLCAKWLKSENTSSKESKKLAKMTARYLEMTPRNYRKFLSLLRSYIDVTEVKMSSDHWSWIDYQAVPSKAMINYRKAFGKHDGERFSDFITSVKKGEAKINTSVLYPYEILKKGNLRGEWGDSYYSNYHYAIDKDETLEEMWKALPNYVEGENNVLVMADTSGSMLSEEGNPLATALSLAIYFAERNKGDFKDLFMTFSSNPEFVKLKGSTLAEKISNIKAIVADTNIELAFNTILGMALKNNIPQEEMPKSIVIVSDMQFNQGCDFGYSDEKVLMQRIAEKYKEHGYIMPKIVYWQVCARGESFQAKVNDNAVLVSGKASSTFSYILNSVTKTPYEFMVYVLNSPSYSMIE